MAKQANWTNRKKFLTKAEMKHLVKDAGCRTKAAFQSNINQHDRWREENPEDPEPCWDCNRIAGKLGMVAG